MTEPEPQHISLKEYLAEVRRHDRELWETKHEAKQALWDKEHEADQRALTIALDRNKELLALHNDLIRKGERDAARYVTMGQVYTAVITALMVWGLIMTYQANFGG